MRLPDWLFFRPYSPVNRIDSSLFLPMPRSSVAFVKAVDEFDCKLHEETQPGSERAPECYLVSRPATGNTFPIPVHLATPEVLQLFVEEDDRRHGRKGIINLPGPLPTRTVMCGTDAA